MTQKEKDPCCGCVCFNCNKSSRYGVTPVCNRCEVCNETQPIKLASCTAFPVDPEEYGEPFSVW